MKKIIYPLSFVLLIATSYLSCMKTSVNPITNNQVIDTSKTLIGNVSLVGKWNVLSDTISYGAARSNYHGVSSDHYTFTKYGNLFVKLAPNNYTDTAIYAISSINNSVVWQNIAYSIDGTVSHVSSVSVPYTITSLRNDTLILTSNFQTSAGVRFEEITFKKQ